MLLLAYETARPNGLGEAHFGWRARNMEILRREIGWLLIAITVLSVPGGIVNRNEVFESSLGRLALVVSMLVMCVFVYRLLNPRTGIVREQLAGSKGWVTKLRYVWYPATVVVTSTRPCRWGRRPTRPLSTTFAMSTQVSTSGWV